VSFDDNARRFLRLYPCAYHVTDAGNADSIMRRGLLSTDRLLDLYQATEDQRRAAKARPRQSSVVLRHAEFGCATIRDQLPLNIAMLKKVLIPGTSVQEWLALLDSLVFLWPTVKRVHTLLVKPCYAQRDHDVLVVDTARLVERHGRRLLLSPLNSGTTRSIDHKRGPGTFKHLGDAEIGARLRGGRVDRAVAEVVARDGLGDLNEFVIRIERWHGPKRGDVVWRRT
jgi:hypothetical protein